MLGAQPVEDLGVASAQLLKVAPVGRQDDDVGIFQGAVHGQRHFAEAAHRLAVGADQAGGERGLRALAQLARMAQAGHVEEVLGLHQGEGEGAFDGKDADALQRAGGLGRHDLFLL
ncbi:hypothetical protein D9M70_597650 [compost metagenome]